MPLRVFLTGGFGMLGRHVVASILQTTDHDLVVFEKKTPLSEPVHKALTAAHRPFTTVWGDLTDKATIGPALKDAEVVVHLAAVIPPLSERKPDLARAVNLDGGNNLIECCEEGGVRKFVMASSVAVVGSRPRSTVPPVTVDTPVRPQLVYSKAKAAVEERLRASSIPEWTICRLGAVMSFIINKRVDPYMFNLPLEGRIEGLDARDGGIAFCNAITAPTQGKILYIGGGKKNGWQFYVRDFFEKSLSAAGPGMPDPLAWKIPKDDSDWYYLDWADTAEAEELLKFQRTTWDTYVADWKKELGLTRTLAVIFAPFARRSLIKASPYLAANRAAAAAAAKTGGAQASPVSADPPSSSS